MLTLLVSSALWFPLQGYAADQQGIPALNHVFLIMMENHDYDEPGRSPAILKNESDAPYINDMAKKYNLATNYLAVGHPSLTNYLEVVGGSNFGINKDLSPHWGSAKNSKYRYGFIPAHGADIASSSFAYAKACCDDRLGYMVPGGAPFVGETIADQLEQTGKTWKSYQESLPIRGAIRGGFGVDTSDGMNINHGARLYVAKHNPFEYFRSTQGSKAIVGYASDLHHKTIGGDLAKDLAAGTVADFNFIVPNLCHDMHGTSQCSDAHALIRDGDQEVQALVNAITGSAAWKTGRNAIVVMWDENDFSATGNNRIPVIVMTSYQTKGMHSSHAYNHFSLLKTLEKGFGLHYLNHAKDPEIHAMSDIFAPR
jgi:phosphatidylinositol-3-phosphatase